MNVDKIAHMVHMSWEQYYSHLSLMDDRYSRRIQTLIITQPTVDEWADYRKAKEAHDYLLESPYFDDEGSSIRKPEPRREYIYAESADEWIARCHELREEEA